MHALPNLHRFLPHGGFSDDRETGLYIPGGRLSDLLFVRDRLPRRRDLCGTRTGNDRGTAHSAALLTYGVPGTTRRRGHGKKEAREELLFAEIRIPHFDRFSCVTLLFRKGLVGNL